jgi:hypothetical protein
LTPVDPLAGGGRQGWGPAVSGERGAVPHPPPLLTYPVRGERRGEERSRERTASGCGRSRERRGWWAASERIGEGRKLVAAAGRQGAAPSGLGLGEGGGARVYKGGVMGRLYLGRCWAGRQFFAESPISSSWRRLHLNKKITIITK